MKEYSMEEIYREERATKTAEEAAKVVLDMFSMGTWVAAGDCNRAIQHIINRYEK